MVVEGPAHVYFGACVGRWRAPVSLAITDPDALQRSGMGLLDRWSVRLLAAWPRWLGRLTMDTTVRLRGDEVVHTTAFCWLGLSVRRTVEVFTIDADGRRFTIGGSMTGTGEIDATATRGSYALRWLGVDVRQGTVREVDLVTVHQEGPGFRGVQALARRGA